jgi:hypothetical protein
MNSRFRPSVPVFLVLAVVVLGLILAGCGRSPSASTTTAVPEGGQSTTAAPEGATAEPSTTVSTVQNVYFESFEENGKFGFRLPNTDQVVIPARFDEVGSFSEALCSATVGGKVGVIDATGAWVVQPQYDRMGGFSEGLAIVVTGDKWGMIDRTGAVAIPVQFEELGFFSEGLASAVSGGETGWIDRSGAWVIPAQFERGYLFRHGLAATRSGGKWGYIDKTGTFVIQPQYEYASEFYVGGHMDGTAEVELNGQQLVIDTRGKTVQ